MKNTFLILSAILLLPLLSRAQQTNNTDQQKLTEKDYKTIADSLSERLKVKEGPFKVSVGASFDFFSGQSETDLYYDLNFFIPTIWNEKEEKKGWKKFGLDFSLYQTRLFGDSSKPSILIKPRRYGMLGMDTILADQYILVRKRRTTLDNRGIYISPTYKLRKNLYALLHFEGVLQRETVYLNDGFTDIDSTVKIHVNNYMEPSRADERLRDIEEGEKKAEGQREIKGYLGFGAMLDFTIAEVNFRFKPVAGYADINPRIINPMEKRKLHGWFYLLSVRIVETNSGLRLGLDIRNFFDSSEAPAYSLFLSKNFSLAKLGEFIKSK